jgi:hypothetical protein
MAAQKIISAVVSIDFTDSTDTNYLFFDDTELGLFDNGLFGAASWIGLTEYVRSANVTRGATRAEGVNPRYDAGRATIVLDNRDGRFDPFNLSGPYVTGGVSQVTPMRQVSIHARVQTQGSSEPDELIAVFRGFIDSWDLQYPAGKDAIAVVSCTDGTKVLSAFDGAEQSSQGSGESTLARIERIVSHVGFPSAGVSNQSAYPVRSTCQATTLASNAWTEILLTADTELGQVFFDRTGVLQFRGRGPHNVTTITSITDTGSGIGFSDIALSVSDDSVYNTVSIARTGGTEQTAEDATSQGQYLEHTFNRTDLVHETDESSASYAAFVLAQTKDAWPEVHGVTVDAKQRDGTQVESVLSRDLGDWVEVTCTPPGSTQIVQPSIVRGVSHSFAPGSWTVQLALQDLAPINQFAIFTSSDDDIVFDTSLFAY